MAYKSSIPQSGSGGGGVTSFTSPNSTLTVAGTTTLTADINLSHSNHWTAAQDIGRDASTGSMSFPTEAIVAESSTATAIGIYTNSSTVDSSHIAELFMGEAKTQGFNGFSQVQIQTFTDNAGSTGSQFFKLNFVGRDNAGAIIGNTNFLSVQMGNVTGLQPAVFPGGIVISDFDFANGTMQLTDALPLIITPQQQFFGNNADITLGSTIGGLQITNSNIWISAAAYQGGGFPNTAGNTYIGVAQSSSNTPAGDADGAPGNTIFGGAVDFGQTGNIGWSGVANAQVDASGNAFFESLDLNTEMTIGSIQISSGSIFMPAGIISTDTGTGLKIGSSASELLGFYGVTPVVQPANTVAIDSTLVNLGLRASGGIARFATTIKLRTGGTAVGSEPIQFTSAALLTTATAGTMEFLTDKYYGTITTAAARKEFTLNDAALTSGQVPVVTTNGRLINGGATATELGFLSGVTSAIQTQFAGKLSNPTSVALTNQAADITATNLATITGTYFLTYVLEDTSSDVTAGAVTLTFSWTDGAGATTLPSSALVLTSQGRTSGTVVVQLASGNLTYATSHTGLFGTAKYALYITTIKTS